ncbi:hypothetical protein NliqN6_4738 [Naganishia liquefaciens]|uniref:Uncharacterized protein n=1 Tax=Naganishia liquefaciens TaxID=104408 RepID=A0A8H3TVI8_9TREE|nr:hypothetical protein NliqN6_4738 [Naganishia liquefaciens]
MSASTSPQAGSTFRESERGYFDLAPPPVPNDAADEDPEVSRRERAKRRYSLTMYQHIMAMRQSMNKDG